MQIALRWGLVLGLLSLAACGDDAATTSGQGGAGGGGTGSGGALPEVAEGCDPLVPTQCGFPFPSDFWLVDDPSTASGKRVAFGEGTLPVHPAVGHVPPSLVGESDGFSTGQAPMTHLPGATITGLPTQHDLARSLEAGCPSVLIDVERGELVAHFAEVDMAEPNAVDRALMIRPAARLRDGARYVVAFRGVVGEDGAAIPPSGAFRALRDGVATGDPRIDDRGDRYEEIFATLGSLGVAREDLQIAWDFTTASTDNNTRWLLHMRDVALDIVGDAGPAYVIDEVVEAPNDFIARRIVGRFTVPNFMDSPEPRANLVFGDDGLPEVQGEAEYTFVVQIPNAATTGTPGAILQTGHGQLGSWNQGLDSYYAEIADQGNFVHGAVDLIGMASGDSVVALEALSLDPMLFRSFFGRQLQGMTNQLVFMRMLKGAFAEDPLVDFGEGSAIDTSEAYYRGSSQGGIFGATYMAVSTDVTRGVLDVPGAPYNLLLDRSKNFAPFAIFLRSSFKGSRDAQVVLGLVQMLWDRIEPNGYLPFVRDPLPGTPPHEVLLQVAIGDQQVTPLGAHYMARTMGAALVTPAARPLWGLTERAAPFEGSAIVEWDFGDRTPPLPDTNRPTGESGDGDPHEWTRSEPASVLQAETFLRTGVVTQTCDGACDPD